LLLISAVSVAENNFYKLLISCQPVRTCLHRKLFLRKSRW